MNNNQFRRLFDTPSSRNDGDSNAKKSATSTLGTKKSSFMPMTPRTVKGSPDVDFARQLRERNAALQPSKKFKTAVPKGVKYGAGYTDRAKVRAEGEKADGEDDKASRIKALEEQMKLGQIPEATFEALRDEITGGDVASTHLVKGLDRKLLDRVRRGEDVLGLGGGEGSAEQPPDVDEALDKLEEKEVEVMKREKVAKKGTMAPPPPVAGAKRSRDEIMAELKAQRKAAAEAKVAPVLDNRWRKIGEEKNRIKIDQKGREVLITVDEDGVVKKKVRKVSAADKGAKKAALDMPDGNKPVLGSDAVMPELEQLEEVKDEDDDDIFEGIGAQYNPLGNDDDEDDSSLDEEDEDDDEPPKHKSAKSNLSERAERSTEEENRETSNEVSKAASRNYFNDTPSTTDEPARDRMAGVQELLKKAAKMDSVRSVDTNIDVEETEEDREARLKKRAQMLAQQDRDFEDVDMGFGSSRYGDREDEEEGKEVKLSEWRGSASAADEDGRGGERGERGKKKRKPKKRKGDANNMGDIMRVIEERNTNDGGGALDLKKLRALQSLTRL